MLFLEIGAIIFFYFYLSNIISYKFLKKRVLKRQKWDLNICCGKTDGGGLNVDIVKHKELPNFQKIDDMTDLPFKDNQFETVLSSHTIEHLDDPEAFFRELQRVGKKVTLILPPLWDITAAFNILEHKWVFLTILKEHNKLPKFVKLTFSDKIHKLLGQKIKA